MTTKPPIQTRGQLLTHFDTRTKQAGFLQPTVIRKLGVDSLVRRHFCMGKIGSESNFGPDTSRAAKNRRLSWVFVKPPKNAPPQKKQNISGPEQLTFYNSFRHFGACGFRPVSCPLAWLACVAGSSGRGQLFPGLRGAGNELVTVGGVRICGLGGLGVGVDS